MVLFLFKGYAHQILFFLLAIILSIKKFIFGNDDEKDEDSKKIKEDMLNLTTRFEEIERKSGILTMNNEQLTERINQIESKDEYLFFQQNLMTNYQDVLKEKNKLNLKNNKLRVNYLLLSFSGKVKNAIAFIRIINFRKIVNCLLNHIIEKNNSILKKTNTKFYDILKPKDNQKPFFIIHCIKDVNGITIKEFNIILDFMMFIHNYTSSIIHLNNIENYKDIIPKIEKSNEEDSSDSAKKRNSSFYPNELIDYVFTSYNIEKETKEMIMKLEIEEKQIINNTKNKINFIKIKEDKENPKGNEINIFKAKDDKEY